MVWAKTADHCAVNPRTVAGTGMNVPGPHSDRRRPDLRLGTCDGNRPCTHSSVTGTPPLFGLAAVKEETCHSRDGDLLRLWYTPAAIEQNYTAGYLHGPTHLRKFKGKLLKILGD